jgi:hypothetical protein
MSAANIPSNTGYLRSFPAASPLLFPVKARIRTSSKMPRRPSGRNLTLGSRVVGSESILFGRSRRRSSAPSVSGNLTAMAPADI